MLHYIFLEYLLHTNPHKNVYISKQNNAINIISSDSESTIHFTLENHVFGKTHILSFFLILNGLCPSPPAYKPTDFTNLFFRPRITPLAFKPTQKSYLKSDKPRTYLPDFTVLVENIKISLKK